MITTRVEPNACLNCGTVHDSATGIKRDAVPKDGDWSICFDCGHLMVFESGKLRNLNDREMYEIAGNRDLIRAQQARARIKAERDKARRKEAS